MSLEIKIKHCANFGERRGDGKINMIILHYTVISEALTLKAFSNPDAEASSHYLINLKGEITQLVDDSKRAWHAGKSFWAGERDINSHSLGIEIVNDGASAYEPCQIAAVINLCKDLQAKYEIPNSRILGHSDIAPARKIDPGKFFPWAELAQDGVGIYPLDCHVGSVEPPRNDEKGRNDNKSVVEKLAIIGYDIAPEVLPHSINAFKVHYAPSLVGLNNQPALISYLDSVINLL